MRLCPTESLGVTMNLSQGRNSTFQASQPKKAPDPLMLSLLEHLQTEKEKRKETCINRV